MHLNIRQKVILGFFAGIVGVCIIGGISYHYLQEIELKQKVVEKANDLLQFILEARRYEKNYLHYGSEEDLKENRRYIHLGQEVLDKIEPDVKNLKGAPQLRLIQQELQAYDQLMEQIAAQVKGKGQMAQRTLEEKLRERGKNLVTLSEQLVKFERQMILNITKTLKAQLFSSLVIFLLFGGFLGLIVSRKIIRPLRVIESTTQRIAQGNFKPMPVWNTRDETQLVVEAFNRMVGELEKRQDQLVQAKKMSSLGVLTAGIAHQLNNPLNNISTSCQILLEELTQADVEFLRKMLTNVEQEVNRARDIVKGLLELSRVREFALKSIPLEDVVRRSIRLISSQVPPGIDIVEEVPWDLILELDAQCMQEVFLNLLMNAIQAIKEPPGEIKIAASQDSGHREAVITMEDTGVGITREELDRIFDPFFTTKEIGVGTGLGLSIVYGIIEKHHGTITAESTTGEGTRFIIRLPLPATPAPERASA